MKTKNLHLVTAFCFLGLLPVKTVALNYTITFTGTGASTTVNSVIVQNLTKGTSVTVPAGNVLNLSDAPNAVEQVSANDETIRVYKTLIDGKFIVSFFAKQAGVTQINAFSMDGQKVTGISTNLQGGSNTFELSLPKGVYVVQVTGNEYAYTAKLLNQTEGVSGIIYKGTEKPVSSSPQKARSSTPGITTMNYTAGDQLLYKGISNYSYSSSNGLQYSSYCTIITDVPIDSKTTNFNFIVCRDYQHTDYAVVTIGNQTWMAENLRSSKLNDGTNIPFELPIIAPIYWTTPLNSNWTTAQWTTYMQTGTTFYNWYAVNTGKLAPTGWHVPSRSECLVLWNYLKANGYNFNGAWDNIHNYCAKSLASNSNWISNTYGGAIGNNLSKNNSTGFSALPGGFFDSNGFEKSCMNASWWCSDEISSGNANFWYLDYQSSGVIFDAAIETNGYSVRCIKN